MRTTRRKRRSRSRWTLSAFGFAAASVVAAGGIGFAVVQDANSAKPDVLGCYAPETASTAVLVDSSVPRWGATQQSDLLTFLSQLYEEGLAFNERFSMFLTAEDRIGTIPPPVLEFCGHARTPRELEDIGAARQEAPYLRRKSAKFRREVFDKILGEVFALTATKGNTQWVESPVLEQVQAISRLPQFADFEERSLVVVSDFLQNTKDAQFCGTKGHLPPFASFRETAYYKRIAPKSLAGVRVTMLALVRDEIGGPGLPYCSEDELYGFWEAFFRAAGAESVEVIRLRVGRVTAEG